VAAYDPGVRWFTNAGVRKPLCLSLRVAVVVVAAGMVAACGQGRDAAGDSPGNVSGPPPDQSTEPVPAVPDAAAWPGVPARVGREQDLRWGHQPEGTIILNGDRTSLKAFARSLRSSGKLPYTPVLPSGVDVGPTVYASPNSAPDVYDMIVIEYASRQFGWFGIWERAAHPEDAATYLTDRLAECDPPVQCEPDPHPTRIALDNGTPAILHDPGGIEWVQNGMVFELAGPWTNFDAARSIPLANAISAVAERH
jgi:hypothetical protein